LPSISLVSGSRTASSRGSSALVGAGSTWIPASVAQISIQLASPMLLVGAIGRRGVSPALIAAPVGIAILQQTSQAAAEAQRARALLADQLVQDPPAAIRISFWQITAAGEPPASMPMRSGRPIIGSSSRSAKCRSSVNSE
jgi:hypothetical protein